MLSIRERERGAEKLVVEPAKPPLTKGLLKLYLRGGLRQPSAPLDGRLRCGALDCDALGLLSARERDRFRRQLRKEESGGAADEEWTLPGAEERYLLPGGERVIDARTRFETLTSLSVRRSRPCSLGTVIRLEDWRESLHQQVDSLTFEGDGISLWYLVKAKKLKRFLDLPLVTILGRAPVGILAGRYRCLSAPFTQELEGAAYFSEITLVTVVKGEEGIRLRPIHRIVDAARLEPGLRRLTCSHPHDLACIRTDRRSRWRIRAEWLEGHQALEIAVGVRYWLNLFGLGRWLGKRIFGGTGGFPISGVNTGIHGLWDLSRIGRVEQVRIPERFHRGIIPRRQVARPLLVLTLPRLRSDEELIADAPPARHDPPLPLRR